MEQLQKDILNMKKEKMTLFVSTTAFRRNLLDLLGECNFFPKNTLGMSHRIRKKELINILSYKVPFFNLYLFTKLITSFLFENKEHASL